MKNAFEAVIAVRSRLRERSAALIENWELLMWLNQALADLSRRTLCYEREVILQAKDKIRKYEWKFVLPDFAGKVRSAWYRNYPLALIQDIDAKFWNQSFFNSTSTQPLEMYYDSQFLGIKWIPAVTNYSTGTASFVNGSASVVGVGTVWSSNLSVHDAIGAGAEPGKFYSIRSIESDTELTLEEEFTEASAPGVAYVGTNGAIRLQYVAAPPVIRTISYTTGMVGTMTFTKGSRTVTTSGAPSWLTTAKRGMHIGLGTATGSGKPSRWYIIRKIVSDTELELAQPYEEATAAGAGSAVLTDDSPFEPTIMEAAVAYAASMGLQKYNRPEASAEMQLFEMRVIQVKQEVDARYSRHAPLPRIIDTYNGFIQELDHYG